MESDVFIFFNSVEPSWRERTAHATVNAGSACRVVESQIFILPSAEVTRYQHMSTTSPVDPMSPWFLESDVFTMDEPHEKIYRIIGFSTRGFHFLISLGFLRRLDNFIANTAGTALRNNINNVKSKRKCIIFVFR